MPRAAQPRYDTVRTAMGSQGGAGRHPAFSASDDPCNRERDSLDVAGRVNDLINCYLSRVLPWLSQYGPQIILAVLLLVIMALAAWKMIKDEYG